METTKGSSNTRNMIYSGKISLLPPKSPFPSISPSFVDYVSSPATGPKGIAKPRVGNSHHQRTSSENVLMEEQPSWLDELLNEPEMPVRKGGHRRSSSDSFAYVDATNASSLMDHVSQDEYKYKNLTSLHSWASEDYDNYSDVQHASVPVDPNFRGIQKNRVWDSSLNLNKHPSDVPSARVNILQSSGLSCTRHEADGIPSAASEKWDSVESGPRDSSAASERECSHAKPSASEADTRRSKQQFAQRSRVRKLQYIAELERNVQALQAEGSEASAELEFLRQQNLILGMENKALKQRLENLAQEQLIKYMEHEVLEREIGRLRILHQQQQQQQQQTSSGHRRTNSRDLDSKFANLSLKQKDPSSGCDAVSGSLHV